MDAPFSVLVVCRANVCRSPLAQVLLVRYLQRAGIDTLVAVASAGTDARPGEALCGDAAAWSGESASPLRARQVTPRLLREADLVVAADRGSRAACSQFDPGCRTRLFTLTQAATLARYVDEQVAAGRMPDEAPAMPQDPVDRLRWLVGEMDASRRVLSGRDEDGDDILDQHGPQAHVGAFAEVDAAVRTLADALSACVGEPRVGG